MARSEHSGWFPHDDSASLDMRLLSIRADHGLAALGAYWIVIETLYRSNGLIKPRTISGLAAQMGISRKEVETYLEAFAAVELIRFDDDGCIYSERANKELLRREANKKKAEKMNAQKWGSRVLDNDLSTIDNDIVNESSTIRQRDRCGVVVESTLTPLYNNNTEDINTTRARGPSLGEVTAHFGLAGMLEEAPRFYNHYDGQGWVVGNGQPIANWQAKADEWIANERKKPKTEQNVIKPKYKRGPVEPDTVAKSDFSPAKLDRMAKQAGHGTPKPTPAVVKELLGELDAKTGT